MGKDFRIFTIIAALFAAATITAAAQDLGSSNKLFGPDKKKTVKKTEPKPARSAASTSRGRRSTPKRSSSQSQIRTGRNQPEIRTEKASTVAYRPMDPETLAQYDKLINEGNEARNARDYAAGEAAYSRAKALRLRDARAPYGLGNIYADQHRWEKAEREYRDALRAQADDADVQLALSYVLTQPVAAPDLSARYQEAEELARKVVDKRPNDPVAHDQLGVSRELLGLIGGETESAYRKAILLAPRFAPAYAHLGRLLRRQGKIDSAKASYDNAISNATNVPLMVIVADVLQSEQRYADSLPLLQRAIAADPRNPSALLLAGRALLVTGELDEAGSMLSRAIAVSPDCYAAHSLMGKLMVRKGNLASAENALGQAARFVSDYEKTSLATQLEMLGDAYRKAGDGPGALRAYKKALSFDPDRQSIAAKASGS